MKFLLQLVVVLSLSGYVFLEAVPNVGDNTDWQYDMLKGDCAEANQDKYVVLANEKIHRDGHFLHTQTAELEYVGNNVVTCLKADNLDEHPGKIALTQGGLGQKTAKLEMKSSLSRGLTFQILILGEKDPANGTTKLIIRE